MSIGKFLKRNLWSEDTMACPEIKIPDVDEKLYGRLLANATSAGATFEGTAARFNGCLFEWNYDAVTAMLRVTPTHLPPLIFCSVVKAHILDLVEKARKAI